MQPPSDTIPGVLRHWARTRPGATFCTFLARGAAETITFGQLDERSHAYAAHYRKLGVRPGETVIVILQHSPHLYYAFLGALLAGAVPSFMAFPSVKQRPEVYWADHAKLFARIVPRLIVTYDANVAAARTALGALPIELLIASDDLLATTPGPDADDVRIEPDGTAVLQHSSGTTGSKKGVMLSHRELVAHARALTAALDLRADDAIVSWLPLYHDMGFIACFMGSILSGTHLVALDPFEWVVRPTLLLDAIAAYRPAFCWLPNFAFSHLARMTPAARSWDLSSIRAFINCSEPCKPATFERFAERFASMGVTPERLHVSYAMAENVFGVTQTPLGRPARTLDAARDAFLAGRIERAAPGEPAMRLLSCGTPLDGVELAIRTADGAPAAAGRIGEIFIRSPFLFSGYDRLPERTAAVLCDGWYKSGDLGFIDGGELFVTGRVDDMLIVNGRNYYAHELELLVNDEPGVAPGRCVAVGVDVADSDATGIAILVETLPETDEADLKRRVKERLFDALALVVHAVVVVPRGELLKTTSGKLDRERNKGVWTRPAIPSPSSS
jgi:acyl-CoA synthetase (AMP-forming)/AMP-acid ligase II